MQAQCSLRGKNMLFFGSIRAEYKQCRERSLPTRRSHAEVHANTTSGSLRAGGGGTMLPTTFTFLGFVHVWGTSRKGNTVVRQQVRQSMEFEIRADVIPVIMKTGQFHKLTI
jgi:hypothetical protein